MAALLGHVGGGEIDGDALGRQSEARGDQCGAHALARFGDRLVAEAHDHECDSAAGDLNLDVDRARLDALESQRGNARHHVRPLRWPCPIEAEHLQNVEALARGIAREFVRPPIYVLHKVCVIPATNDTGNESGLRRDGATTAAEGTLRSPPFEFCGAPIRDPTRRRERRWRCRPPSLFSKLFQISAGFRQGFPKKALAVLWDFKGLQGS